MKDNGELNWWEKADEWAGDNLPQFRGPKSQTEWLLFIIFMVLLWRCF